MTILVKILQSIFQFFVRFPYAVVKDHHSKYRCKVGAGLEPAGHHRPDFFVTPTDYLFADFYNT